MCEKARYHVRSDAGLKAAPKIKALIVQHEEPTPPGFLGEWLDEHGAGVDILRIDREQTIPDPRDYQLIASLGSEVAAFDDSGPFIPPGTELIQPAPEADVPRLGR